MNWPSGDSDFATAARSTFLDEMVAQADYWIEFGSDLITHPQPTRPFQRSWSEAAKKDRAYREAFATLTDEQKEMVTALLKQCVSGAIFSSLCTLDQFPGGEAEVWISDGVCGAGKRKVKISPMQTDLHDDYQARRTQ